jgi:hypothetical protein
VKKEIEMEQLTLTNEQAQDLCDRWQSALRLGGWEIDVQIVRQGDLSDHNNSAEIRYSIPHLHAVLSLLDPNDYDGDSPQDHEVSIVHELLHLRFAGLDPKIKGDAMADMVMEQAICTCALVMVQLKRAANSEEPTTETVSAEPVATSTTAGKTVRKRRHTRAGDNA